MTISGGIQRKAKTTITNVSRQLKLPHGLCPKLTAVVLLGLCFIFVWSFFASTPDTLTSQRESFTDIAEPVSVRSNSDSNAVLTGHSPTGSTKHSPQHNHPKQKHGSDHGKNQKPDSSNIVNVNVNATAAVSGERSESDEGDEKEDGLEDGDGDGDGEGGVENEDVGLKGDENEEADDDDDGDRWKSEDKKKRKQIGLLSDPKAEYHWILCSVRSKHNYIPCIDFENPTGRIQHYRHHERSCPRTPPMCLVPLPPDGYDTRVHWPDCKLKILYKNVAHPKLAAYVKTASWIKESGEYLMFPQNQSIIVGGVAHYLESIEEMVPDIEWGKNVRVVLDIGVTDTSFAASLLDKDVLTLSLGMIDDLVDLTQVALERGFPAFVNSFATRRLPFPNSVFDTIHCSGCGVHWHSRGGRLLLELNRILRPGGYFVLSAKHNNIEDEEAMTSLTASICWNILADKTDEDTEVGVKIFQKPDSSSIYELRRKKNPPMCKENENPDAAWYVPIGHCLHNIPTAIEEHGTEWPTEWPQRLESYPDWLSDKEKVKADTEHWKAIVKKSYLIGMGIDWSNIRNVMDMKAIYGGFAAALSQQKIWVMNVVPVHAPNTLPYIYERGLFGVYHDWCESFGTYPRSYDLLHADHLFSRLKNRCNQPAAIVVEMDRILRPGGWVIVRDKVVILDALEKLLRSLNWDIRMTFGQEKEGILVAQKTTWRP